MAVDEMRIGGLHATRPVDEIQIGGLGARVWEAMTKRKDVSGAPPLAGL